MFKIEFETSNAIFDEESGGVAVEVARILEEVSKKVEPKPWRSSDLRERKPGMTYDFGAILDLNGNSIGTWEWSA